MYHEKCQEILYAESNEYKKNQDRIDRWFRSRGSYWNIRLYY